jgi:hypothetical protein
MRHRLRTGLSAAAVLPLLVLALSAPLNAMRCRLTGQILTACCCPEPDHDESTGISAGDCCERTRLDAIRTPSEPPAGHVPLAPIAWLRPLPAGSDAPTLAPLARPRPRDGTVPRPPLILTKRSFLI